MHKREIYVVPHFHWDREWYFSTEESQVLLVKDMEEILDKLADDPDYKAYVLDGQTVVLEDYLSVCPENFNRIKKFVQEGRLKVGPWYTQTDENIVSGESLTRNLLYGFKDSHKFGNPMMIGYVPDPFGQSAQMPMILNQFQIKKSLFWRGFSDSKGTNSSEFYWKTDNGYKVLAENFPLGYAIGKYLETDSKKLKDRMDKIFDILDSRAFGKYELLPNGHDQMPIQKNIDYIIKKLNKLYPDRHFCLSDFETFFDKISSEQDLPTVQGEMLDGKISRIHRSIYSTRMDLKEQNTKIENEITNLLEPLASLAKSLGFSYEHGLIESIWKGLMKNQAHDSIGNCVSDEVNKEIGLRYMVTQQKVESLIKLYIRLISESIDQAKSSPHLVIFNLNKERRKKLVTATIVTKEDCFTLTDSANNLVPFDVISHEFLNPGLVDRQLVANNNYQPFHKFTIEFEYTFDGMGYEMLNIVPDKNEVMSYGHKVDEINTRFYGITFNNNGTINIKNKETGKTNSNIIILEDSADVGDEYDYSPLKGDSSLYSVNSSSNVCINIMEYKNSYHAEIKYDWSIPKDVESRQKKVNNGLIKVKIGLTVSKFSKNISVNLNIDNQAKEHRLRLLIPTNIKSKFSIADNQFGKIKRPVIDPNLKNWKKENWCERPDTIFPFLTYISLTDSNTTFSVFTNSSREYQVVGKDYDCIAITLLRSIGQLGKPNLMRRPGRPSGIEASTPDSEMIGNLSLDFALRIDNEKFGKCEIAQKAKQYLTPILSYNLNGYYALKLNDTGKKLKSSFRIDVNKALGDLQHGVISTIKLSENNENFLYRVYNPTDQKLKIPQEFNQFTLDENEKNNNQIYLMPNEVITLGIKI